MKFPAPARALILLLVIQANPINAGILTMQTNQLGASPSLLAYNAGHFCPASNTSDWWRYAGVSGARVFISPGVIEPSDDIPGRGDGVTDQASFVSRRAALRADPLNVNYINWPLFLNGFAKVSQHGANILSVDYACAQLHQLGVQILVDIDASVGQFSITDTNDWAGKWELWQHFYAEAFYLARYYDVERYQMYNEPNLVTGLTPDDFFARLQLTSDAIQSALADVNQLYGKSLVPLIHAPVTANTSSSLYATWGSPAVASRHTDFLGHTSADYSLIQNYDYHEYNATAASFGATTASLNSMLASAMSPEPRFPTSISEFNVHTAGTFDTLADTLDTPADYAAFGSIVVSLVNNFCDELYVFKFSQTLNSTTVKKNGMLFVDNTNSLHNIGGITKAGEVWRLFNQASAPGRVRLGVSKGTGTTGLDIVSTYDPSSRYYHVFSANESGSAADVTVNVGAWNIPAGQPALVQEVSENIYGGAKILATVTNNQIVAGTQGNDTAWLVTLPSKPVEPVQTIVASDDATVQDGANSLVNFGADPICKVGNNSTNSSLRSVSLVKFHLPLIYHPDVQIALLTVRASSLHGATVQAHVYGITNTNWSQGSVTWSNAPNLAQNIAAGTNYTNNVILGAGQSAFMLGQLVADGASADRSIDVSDFVRQSHGYDVAFLIMREVRFFGDAQDNDQMNIISTEADPVNGPRLQLVRLKDSDGDGISDEAEINVFATNPYDPDTDGDGISDGQEILLYNTSPGMDVLLPVINAQPTSQTVSSGTNVTFSIAATGTPPLLYQWYFNATNQLTGATNDVLNLTNVQVSQSGAYSVVVSNAGGSVASSSAQLTVTPLPAAPSALIAYDPFNYTSGSSLGGQGGWVLNSGTAGTIQDGNLAFDGLAPSGGNRLTWGNASVSLRLPLGTNLTQGAIYFSFLMRVDGLGASFTGLGTLAGFTFGSSTSFGTKVNIQANGAGGFQLGTSKGGGATYGGWSPATYNVGDTIFVVGRYTFKSGNGTDDLCDLWINPNGSTFGASQPPAATVSSVGAGGTDLSQVDHFFFRAAGASTSPSALVADEVRLGSTWAAVTPPQLPQLNIQNSSAGMKLSWPTNAANFMLEESAGLTPPTWTTVTQLIETSGTNNVVTVGVTNQARFYRLRR